MRQVKQTLGWGGVFRAFFTLMVVPNFANGLPLNPSNSKTFSKSIQTTGRRNDGDVSTVIDTLGKNFTVHDETVLRGLEKSMANRDVKEGNFSKEIKSRTWPLGKEESPVTHGLRSQSLKRPTNYLMRRQRRTLFSLINTGSNSPSQVKAPMTQRTTANVKTFLPQRRRSRAALWSRRRMEDEHISANILNNSITTYQGLNVSSPLSLTINESNSSSDVNSSSQSLWSSSWSSSSSSSYLEDDVHVNRTNDVPNTYDNPRLRKNRLRGFNISNLLRIRKCHENLTDSAEGGNDTSIRSRRRRGLESEGCQVLHVFHGYIMVDPSGLVTTTWDGDDIYSK